MSSILNSFATSNLMNLKNDSESTVVEIDEELLVPFRNHPFEIYGGEVKEKLIASIKVSGITNPIIVRKTSSGKYEVLSGHNRLDAARIIGLEKVPCIVKMLPNDYEAVQMLITANTQRKTIRESEKAKAFKLQYDTLADRHTPGNAIEKIAEDYQESYKTVQRYVKIGSLSQDLLEAMDKGKLPKGSAYEVAFLDDEKQDLVAQAIEETGQKVDMSTAKALRDALEAGDMSYEDVCNLLLNDELKQKGNEKKTFTSSKIVSYFPPGTSEHYIEKVLIQLLDVYIASNEDEDEDILGEPDDIPGQVSIKNQDMDLE